VTIYKADVCNESQLAELFTRYRFTDVIHMAAMAGVRYSVKKPLAYVRNNIQCQMALLNVLKQHKVPIIHLSVILPAVVE
jgi:UDP-glucuronate 4-epimerase